MPILLLALISALILAGGQTSLKHGLIQSGGFSGESLRAIGVWTRILTEPYVILGFVLYAAASILWLRVLSELEMSQAYPLISLSYAFSLVIGHWLFDDTLSFARIAGVIFIIIGAIVVARS